MRAGAWQERELPWRQAGRWLQLKSPGRRGRQQAVWCGVRQCSDSKATCLPSPHSTYSLPTAALPPAGLRPGTAPQPRTCMPQASSVLATFCSTPSRRRSPASRVVCSSRRRPLTCTERGREGAGGVAVGRQQLSGQRSAGCAAQGSEWGQPGSRGGMSRQSCTEAARSHRCHCSQLSANPNPAPTHTLAHPPPLHPTEHPACPHARGDPHHHCIHPHHHHCGARPPPPPTPTPTPLCIHPLHPSAHTSAFIWRWRARSSGKG